MPPNVRDFCECQDSFLTCNPSPTMIPENSRELAWRGNVTGSCYQTGRLEALFGRAETQPLPGKTLTGVGTKSVELKG